MRLSVVNFSSAQQLSALISIRLGTRQLLRSVANCCHVVVCVRTIINKNINVYICEWAYYVLALYVFEKA